MPANIFVRSSIYPLPRLFHRRSRAIPKTVGEKIAQRYKVFVSEYIRLWRKYEKKKKMRVSE